MKFTIQTSVDGLKWVDKPKLATENEKTMVDNFNILKRTGDYPALRILLGNQVISLYRADGRYPTPAVGVVDA